MPQMPFQMNQYHFGRSYHSIQSKQMLLTPFNVQDSISLNTVNFAYSNSAGNSTYTMSLGIYSLTGSTFSLTNSGSVQLTRNTTMRAWASISTFSATSNLTPGTWYFGFLNNATEAISLAGASILGGGAFPNALNGGSHSVSTAALPSTIHTSDVDILTDTGEFYEPMIIVSA